MTIEIKLACSLEYIQRQKREYRSSLPPCLPFKGTVTPELTRELALKGIDYFMTQIFEEFRPHLLCLTEAAYENPHGEAAIRRLCDVQHTFHFGKISHSFWRKVAHEALADKSRTFGEARMEALVESIDQIFVLSNSLLILSKLQSKFRKQRILQITQGGM